MAREGGKNERKRFWGACQGLKGPSASDGIHTTNTSPWRSRTHPGFVDRRSMLQQKSKTIFPVVPQLPCTAQQTVAVLVRTRKIWICSCDPSDTLPGQPDNVYWRVINIPFPSDENANRPCEKQPVLKDPVLHLCATVPARREDNDADTHLMAANSQTA